MATQTPTLHYIFDPLCGWCYGAAPLVAAARGIAGLTVVPHGGGMMTGGNRQPVTEALRRYVMPHDERIAGLTGQPFGADYFDGLLRDSGAVFDSEPPTTAILAAQTLAGRGLDLLHRLQQAHYVQGLRIADPAVLRTLAAEIGLDTEAFGAAYAAAAGPETAAHIAASRKLLAQVGGTGFPTLALERDGVRTLLEPSRYLGRPEQWQAHLRERIREPEAGRGAS
ncbi:DsbA family protein [Achromobacter sp. NPDC058515]|uniref:DsbA family protein n=1 Tax=Achromobacter sp. NPDC058515 TaxID=3346533 RepID=UPI00365E0817